MSGGRPTVISDRVVRKLEAALRDGFNVSEACLVSGVSRSVYYERKASDSVFADKMELAQKYVTIRAKKVVVQAIDDGNFNAAKWWLEHRERDEFGSRTVSEETKEQQQERERAAEKEDDTLRQIINSLKDQADVAIAHATTVKAA